MSCPFNEIPQHLNRNGRESIAHFADNELLYRRDEFTKELNFSKISLAHLSVNRSGTEVNFLSSSDDVRHVIRDGLYEYFDGPVTTITLSESSLANGGELHYTEQYDNKGVEATVTASMKLRHEPEDCNFAHSIFVFIYQGEEMIALPKELANYDGNLGKGAKYVKRLRQSMRDDIDKMICEDFS